MFRQIFTKMAQIINIGIPHIGEQIFERLDNQSLTKCREVCKSWKKLIDHKNIPWNRILMKFPSGEGMYTSDYHRFEIGRFSWIN